MPTARETSFPHVLALGLETALGSALSRSLESHFGHPCVTIEPSVEAAASVRLEKVDLALVDLSLGWGALEALSERCDELPVVVVGPDHEGAWMVDAVEHGALDAASASDLLNPDRCGGLIEKLLAQADVRRTMRRLMIDIRTTASQLKARNDKLEHELTRLEMMAWTDPLTGLANRRQLQERLPQLFAEAVRYGRDLACLMIDLDRFKAVNDREGHARGDDLLVLTGRVIQSTLRGSDIAARYGGDEFVVLMPQTGARTAARVAQRLVEQFGRQAGSSGSSGTGCGMSIGVASISVGQPLDGDGLLGQADAALYAAKGVGPGRVMLWGAEGRCVEASTVPGE